VTIVMSPGLVGGEPSGHFLTATEIIARAHEVLSASVWDYVAGGADSETTKRRNREAIERWSFRPRVLRNVVSVDCATTLLGARLRLPVLIAPIGSLQLVTPDGAAAAVRGAAAGGTLAIVSSVSQPSLEASGCAAAGPRWFQLYLRGDLDWVGEMARRVEQAGYSALVITVDAPVYSIRERQLRHRWLPPSKSVGSSGEEFQAMLDWGTFARLRERIRLPIVLKGIQTAEDAELAVRHGAAAVYVSNHGGRQLDHARAGFAILPEIVSAVGGKLPIIVDGGVLRGSDVVKALALGADAIAIGRLYAYALAADGADGVSRLLEILEHEVRTTMAMLGVASLTELRADHLERGEPPAGGCDPFPFLLRDIRM
jgi:isopentenyl diphosphate isomerase/L-lactate dehydrogenase-like FMN-dependent dehydrogenase